MIWLWAAVGSALLLGLYDVAKKSALQRNGVLDVLLWSTVVSTLPFSPLIISSLAGWHLAEGTMFEMNRGTSSNHLQIMVKAFLVTLSWISGFLGLKHLPITTVGIIKASRPVFVILGCILIFGERLNFCQWAGVVTAMTALYLLGRSSRREGIDFKRNKWVFCMAASVLFGVMSALFDKYIMREMDAIFVQGWCNLYISFFMAAIVICIRAFKGRGGAILPAFRWDWTIVVIALFITVADFLYFYSLSCSDSLLSVISILRRSSVVVTFLFGAVMFHEKNLWAKGLETLLLLFGMALLLFGSY